MSIDQILDEVYPLTDLQRFSDVEMKLWVNRRNKLKKLIEQYRAGEVINFEPLKIGVNLEELLKRIRN